MHCRLFATVIVVSSKPFIQCAYYKSFYTHGRFYRVLTNSEEVKVSISSRGNTAVLGSSTILNRSLRKMTSISPEAKAKLDKIRDVVIDESGRFKYILIKVYAEGKKGDDSDSNSKFIVRGRADCPYHGDIYDKYQEELQNMEGIDDEILGGGRIERTGNKISVFGYSQGYGRADHTITVGILKRYFPSHEISWSNDGY